jgi:membrane protease YdiL (CAAX protease family)
MILCVAVYSLFFSFLWLTKEKRANRLFDNDGLTSNPVLLIVFHIAGILIFGFTPVLSGHGYSYLTIQPIASIMILVTIALVGLCIIISYHLASKKFNQFPLTVSLQIPGNFLIVIYFITRILFICFYEIWFRGFLLNYGIDNLGTLSAVLVNVCLYSLLHMVNGRQEMISCIPFGILLCYLSIWQGSALPAIAIHLALTLTYELSFLKKIKTFQTTLI